MSQRYIVKPELRETLRPIDEPLLIERDHVSFNRQVEHTLDLHLITRALADLQIGTASAAPTPAALQTAAHSARGPFLGEL